MFFGGRKLALLCFLAGKPGFTCKVVFVTHDDVSVEQKSWITNNKMSQTRVARFFLVQHNKTGENIPNCYKMYQMAIKNYQFAVKDAKRQKI
jgi:hypothetical protein